VAARGMQGTLINAENRYQGRTFLETKGANSNPWPARFRVAELPSIGFSCWRLECLSYNGEKVLF